MVFCDACVDLLLSPSEPLFRAAVVQREQDLTRATCGRGVCASRLSAAAFSLRVRARHRARARLALRVAV